MMNKLIRDEILEHLQLSPALQKKSGMANLLRTYFTIVVRCIQFQTTILLNYL
jgi:hypothetical protein